MKAFEDLRVLDLADEKGSFCSKLLADLGASVIKIEDHQNNNSENISPDQFFDVYHNANKSRLVLDLKKVEDREVFTELVCEADVLVETFQPGYLESINLHYERLKKENPAIIHAAITGFGRCCPGRAYRSCDLVASACGGQMYIMGDPMGKPQAPLGGQSYYTASLFGAIQIILALRKRSQSGEGAYIDLSLQEAVASTLDNVMVRWFYEKTITKRQGNLYGNNFFCILPCKDGHIQISLFQQWETLVELMAADKMSADLADVQWKDDSYRTGNISHIIEIIGTWIKHYTAEELFTLGQAMHLPWAPVYSVKDVLKSPQLNARQFFVEIDSPGNTGKVVCPSLPFTFSSFSRVTSKPAPFHSKQKEKLSVRTLRTRTNRPQKTSRPNTISPVVSSRDILAGVRVLDFTWMLSGPYATRILADCGAEVIKIQSKKTANGAEMNTAGYFNTWNRNKRSITLDLSHPEACRIILRLASISDIVVENFSPRVMQNWGLTYDIFKEIKPDLIMASISAMGQTGPWKDFVGYGPTFHALSGLTAMTSAGGKSPVGFGHAYADTIIGLYSALAILSALKHRDSTGEGQYIDVSGYEAVCTLLGPDILRASAKDFSISHNSQDSAVTATPHGCYRCAGDDRWCVIAVFTEDEWRAFCALLGNPVWTKEAKFSTPALRYLNRNELDRHVEEWTCRKNPETVVKLLRNQGITAGIVKNAEDLSKDPCLASREFFIELTHPILGKTISDRSAIVFPKEITKNWKAAPLLGQDNQYVFMDLLGLSSEEFLGYKNRGIIS